MYLRQSFHGLLLATVVCGAVLSPRIADATIVEFQTALGNFQVNLFDNATPQTVTNFLDYVNNGAYTNSIYHRSVTDFVIQGGGFTYDMALPLDNVTTNAPVTNEPEFANVRGTIAMAKLGGDPNSATSQWFINLADNRSNLDGQNGGFTAFGQVIGNGMDVVDAIAALPIYNFGSPANELPLRNYTATDFANNVTVTDTHLVIISAVVVTDTTVDSAAGLNPVANTTIAPPPAPAPTPTLGGGGGGGGLGFGTLAALLLVGLSRKSRRI